MVRLISLLVIGILCWLGISVLGAIGEENKKIEPQKGWY